MVSLTSTVAVSPVTSGLDASSARASGGVLAAGPTDAGSQLIFFRVSASCPLIAAMACSATVLTLPVSAGSAPEPGLPAPPDVGLPAAAGTASLLGGPAAPAAVGSSLPRVRK